MVFRSFAILSYVFLTVRTLAALPSEILLLDLSGIHRFQLGDQPEWQRPDWDDASWAPVTLPGSWQTQGIGTVCDIGWYRIRFDASSLPSDRALALSVGFVGNISAAYLNGTSLGSTGSFDPIFSPPSRTLHLYSIPSALLDRHGTNLLALRIYNQAGGGGILQGPIGIGDQTTLELVATAALTPRAWTSWLVAITFWTLWGLMSLTVYHTKRFDTFRWAWFFTGGTAVTWLIVLLMFYDRYPYWGGGIAWAIAMLTLATIPLYITDYLHTPSWPRQVIGWTASGFALLVATQGHRTTWYEGLCDLGALVTVIWLGIALVTCLRAIHQGTTGAKRLTLCVALLFIGPTIDTFTSSTALYTVATAPVLASELSFLVVLPILAYLALARFWVDQSRLKQLNQRVMAEGEQERRRLARDLHDGVGQSLQAAKLMLQLHDTAPDRFETRGDLVRQMDECLEEIRALSRELHPSFLQGRRVEQALTAYIDQLKSQHNQQFHLRLRGTSAGEIPEQTTAHVYLMIKEIVGNALRHADCTEIRIETRATQSALHIQVTDNGKGFDPQQSSNGLGLVSLHERSELIQADLRLESHPHHGTRVFIRVPISTSTPPGGSSDVGN